MEGRCATCAFAEYTYYPLVDTIGREFPIMCERDDKPDSKFSASGNAMLVSPDFGCVQWEPKP